MARKGIARGEFVQGGTARGRRIRIGSTEVPEFLGGPGTYAAEIPFQPFAARAEGAAAGFGTEDDELPGQTPHRRVASVAPVGEK